jgi:archaeal flagellin FlaB
MEKKAEMGVGTLIIFIAMLLVAAVAAGVLIQTAGSLQERALSTGRQSTSQISTNAETIEVSATNGQNGNLTDFTSYMKLSPGSDPIKLNQVIFTMNTKDNTATLKYRGENSICEKNNQNGYNTFDAERINAVVNNTINHYTLEDDLDDDGLDDHIYVYNATHLAINLSDNGTIYLAATSGWFNQTGQNPIMDSVLIENNSIIYGTIDLNVQIGTAYNIPTNGTFSITPFRLGEGYFSIVYEQQGTNWINGNMQRGDVIRLCFEAPRDVIEDEMVRLNFIPKIGTPTLTQFVTPDVISTERVYLYP